MGKSKVHAPGKLEFILVYEVMSSSYPYTVRVANEYTIGKPLERALFTDLDQACEG